MSFEAYSEEKTPLINQFIDANFLRFRKSVSLRFSQLVDAMEYSLAGGGKRLRPLWVLASAEFLGIPIQDVLPAAAAIEYLHTYSLIHDDLPAMDDDDMRRGKPSSHKQFGEAVAILAGDALLTEAFGLVHQLGHDKKFDLMAVLNTLELLVHSSGVRGMVGGQLLDVTIDPNTASLPEVEFIHIHKTGAMILCSVLLPAKLKPPDEKRLKALVRYGETVGLAFQISDDLLDSEATIRYSRGPRRKTKPSFGPLMSPVEMREKLNSLIDTAVESVRGPGRDSSGLVAIAEFIRTRKK